MFGTIILLKFYKAVTISAFCVVKSLSIKLDPTLLVAFMVESCDSVVTIVSISNLLLAPPVSVLLFDGL